MVDHIVRCQVFDHLQLLLEPFEYPHIFVCLSFVLSINQLFMGQLSHSLTTVLFPLYLHWSVLLPSSLLSLGQLFHFLFQTSCLALFLYQTIVIDRTSAPAFIMGSDWNQLWLANFTQYKSAVSII